jgi:hypothetical protein
MDEEWYCMENEILLMEEQYEAALKSYVRA